MLKEACTFNRRLLPVLNEEKNDPDFTVACCGGALPDSFYNPAKNQYKEPYFLVLPQLLKPENWRNWQPDMHEADHKNPQNLKITKRNKAFTATATALWIDVDNSQGFAFTVHKKTSGKNSIYTFVAIPDIAGNTLVLVDKRSNIIGFLYNYIGKNNFEPDIFALKNYMEDARLYYGFDIRRTTVTDSNVVVIKQVVPAKNKVAGIEAICLELQDFIKKEQLKEVQPVIADIRNAGQDSLRMMIGIPVNRQTTSAGKVQFMHLPQHGHMLTGLYNGKYSGREKLYTAMRTFIADHNLATPEDPYEKYLDNKIPANDSSLVHLQVNFPIY